MGLASQFLLRAAGKEGVTFLHGVTALHKNKLKYEIFNNKKVYKQNCFSLS